MGFRGIPACLRLGDESDLEGDTDLVIDDDVHTCDGDFVVCSKSEYMTVSDSGRICAVVRAAKGHPECFTYSAKSSKFQRFGDWTFPVFLPLPADSGRGKKYGFARKKFFIFEGQRATLESPNYPQLYPPDQNVTYEITVPKG